MKQINYLVGTVGSKPWDGAVTEGRDRTNFRMAVNYDRFDAKAEAYEHVDTTWYDVRCFGALATNTKSSLKVGDSVIVIGRIREREWTTEDGKKGTSLEIIAEAIGPNLRFYGAQSLRQPKPEQASSGETTASAREMEATPPDEVPQPAGAAVAVGAGSSEDPPF